MNDTYILESAVETVYERPEEHGEPEDTFSLIAEFWSSYLDIDIDDTDVAKLFILMKVARSAEGHYDEDNPEDVAGYAENWARLEQEEPEPNYGTAGSGQTVYCIRCDSTVNPRGHACND